MLESLTIQNFQSWKNATLSFTPGVNWILGSSDQGKSAIIRSLRWVWFNEPSAFPFRSWWCVDGDQTVVTAKHVNGPTVVRARSLSKNTYSLDGQQLVSFGDSVPEVVARALNVDSINLQQQGDRPFLIGLNAPEVARYLNGIANLTIIDEAHTRISGKMRTCDADTNAQRVAAKTNEEKLARFDDIDNVAALLSNATGIEKGVAKNEAELAALQQLTTALSRVNEKIAGLADLKGLSTDEVTECAGRLEAAEAEYAKLSAAMAKHTVATEKLEKLAWLQTEEGKTASEKASEIALRLAKHSEEYATLSVLVDKLEKLNTRIAALREIDNLDIHSAETAEFNLLETIRQHDVLEELRASVVTHTVRIEGAEAERKQLEKERDGLMPDACPLCGALKCNQLHS